MATLGTNMATYADWARTRDPDGTTADIIDILSQTNEMLADAQVIEGNLPTGHVHTVRTGLPEATWRMLNQGVGVAKSTSAQITDACGMLEIYSEIDCAIADLNGNTAEFRFQEDIAFLEGMSQQMAEAYVYSNALTTPQQIMGLAPRYSTVTAATAQTANNVIDAGGTGSTNTSIWIVCWGPRKVHCIMPKGSNSAGLMSEDKGKVTSYQSVSTTGTQTMMEVYRRHYKWTTGMTVADWRFAARVCNIDVTQLLSGTAPNLVNGIVRALYKLPVAPSTATPVQSTTPSSNITLGNTVIYCNRVIATYLHLQAMAGPNMFLTQDQFAGKPITRVLGIPVKTVDAILNTEARIT